MPYCSNCGFQVGEDDNYCPDCGSHLPTISDSIEENGENQMGISSDPLDDVSTSDKSSVEETTRHTHFYVGAVVASICVIIFPFFLVFVAIPESIAAMMGTTLVKYLPEDARDNPFVKGSFLIIRWFGNFLILVIILAIIVLIFLSF